MKALEDERRQREQELAEEAKRQRVQVPLSWRFSVFFYRQTIIAIDCILTMRFQAEQMLMQSFARRQQTEEEKRRREDTERRTRQEKELARLRAEAEELKRKHEEEVARAMERLQQSNMRKAEIERVKAEMEAKLKREEEEMMRKFEAEKRSRLAGPQSTSRWEIDPAAIERGKMLGKGAFGEVPEIMIVLCL